MSPFLLFFFFTYGGVHLYSYYKATSAIKWTFGVKAGVAVFMLLMVPAPILIHFLKIWRLELFARIASHIGYIWMGFIFLFFSASLLIDFYNLLVRLAKMLWRFDNSRFLFASRAHFLLACLLSIAIGSYGLFDARKIRTEKLRIVTSKLPADIDRLTIVHISDIHLGLIVRHGLLKKIIRAVNAAEPDLVVSTGDLVDAEINHLPGLADLFQQVNPKYGKFAILGNHEFYAGMEKAIAFTERAGFELLRNEGLTVRGIFNIAGIDDRAVNRMAANKLKKERDILDPLPGDIFTIFLKHRPEVSQDTVGLFDLQLSGHAHCGQIFPFKLITHLVYPMQNGLYSLSEGCYLYTSRGTGTWGPPMRFLAPPEVTLIEIVHEQM